MAGENITEVAIAEAVADTEKEVFDDALGNEPLEETGDRSLEQMDDGNEGEADGDAGEAEASGEGEGKQTETQAGDKPPRDEKTGQFAKASDGNKPGIPPGRLKEEGDRRRAAEALAGDLQSRFDTLQKQFDALQAGLNQRQQQPQNQQQQQEPQPPDMFEDPQGYQRYMLAQADQRAAIRFTNASLADAKEANGETFDQAYAELTQVGAAEKQQFGASVTVAKIWNAPNPGRALMNWHKERAAMREVGSDPEAWLSKRLEALMDDPKFQARIIERARDTAKQNGTNTTRLPPSLNSQTGASQHQGNGDPGLYDNSEDSVMAFALK